MMSAPALAKSATRSSGSTIICAAARSGGWAAWAGMRALSGAREGGRGAHQVDVQDLVGDGAQRINHQGADGDVGHEAAVHDVHVHPVAAGLVNGLHLQPMAANGRGLRGAPSARVSREAPKPGSATRNDQSGMRPPCYSCQGARYGAPPGTLPPHLLAQLAEVGAQDGGGHDDVILAAPVHAGVGLHPHGAAARHSGSADAAAHAGRGELHGG